MIEEWQRNAKYHRLLFVHKCPRLTHFSDDTLLMPNRDATSGLFNTNTASQFIAMKSIHRRFVANSMMWLGSHWTLPKRNTELAHKKTFNNAPTEQREWDWPKRDGIENPNCDSSKIWKMCGPSSEAQDYIIQVCCRIVIDLNSRFFHDFCAELRQDSIDRRKDMTFNNANECLQRNKMNE